MSCSSLSSAMFFRRGRLPSFGLVSVLEYGTMIAVAEQVIEPAADTRIAALPVAVAVAAMLPSAAAVDWPTPVTVATAVTLPDAVV